LPLYINDNKNDNNKILLKLENIDLKKVFIDIF